MEKKPWYQWAHRWNQVNTAETDPRDCDLNVWKEYWRKNHIQGTIVNAAGTVGYYPSANPYQYRAKFLGDRDYVADMVLERGQRLEDKIRQTRQQGFSGPDMKFP